MPSRPDGRWRAIAVVMSAPQSPKRAAAQAIRRVQPQVDYLEVIREVLPADGFFVDEVSQVGFTSWFAFPVYQPRTFVSSGYQGSLGFGFPTALGVKTAFPDRAVVSITGDGGFMFGVQELATAESFGVTARRVTSPHELRPALEDALAAGAPRVIEVRIPRGSETSPWEFLHPSRNPERLPV
jgi:acetolactate synthase I/II/III large subunit